MLLWTAFILGLAGSLHCAGMCGPLALALPRGAGGPARLALSRFLYNGGRVLTYMSLGLLAGAVGQTLALAGWQRWISLGAGTAILLGWLLSQWMPLGGSAFRLVGQLKNALGRLLHQRTLSAVFFLGLLNGLLPCGLVYVACAGAAATGSILWGGAFMLLFGLGTVPMMFSLGFLGGNLQAHLRRRLTKLVPASLLLVSMLLILRGMALGIPYLSPADPGSANGAPACHPQAGPLTENNPPRSTP